ncbi:hypothetical protein AT959_12235 [Dechloromonas denitrificans]|uniref:Glycosyl transferase family 1 n=1 Tax=Dechloromonas denitrificans TaxID=281362 RepID=A0A133XGW0_9RHOO|nr:hypothetical protein [Dechloromonas denitrificans]KXB30136.1 hypothetical protein AT959_12235 [Dechloromonas denitrificans]
MATTDSRPIRILVLQRESLVAAGVPSLSVSARITEVLDYMASLGGIEHAAISEADPCADLGVEWADILILSKHNSSTALGLAQLASGLGVKIVYDIDDWIFSFPAYSGGHAANNRNFAHDIIELADVVTVANNELLRRLPKKIPGISPVLMPNGMWVERYFATNRERQQLVNPRILFTNADFLKVQSAKDSILTALHVFFSRHPDYVLDFFGDPFPEMFSLPFLHFTNRMPYESYMRAIVAGDYVFAITPLGADEDEESVEFNACKNPFKYINYGTAKIPGIYSNADIYKSCVQDGETGLLIENSFEAWLEALELMAYNDCLRERIRVGAHDDVRERFHVRHGCKVLQTIVSDLVCR